MDTAMQTAERVAIIGAGHVGATTAYALMLRALFREIVLVDSDRARAAAEAQDITDANALARPTRIWAGDYADAAGARIAVITAGAATHGAETRLSVATRSAAIVRSCVAQLVDAGFSGVMLVAANPVDLMTMVALDAAGLPASRVFGTGTLLDSNRLRALLAAKLNVAPSAVDALILGEHGDSEVAMLSAARVGGITLGEFSRDAQELDHGAIATAVRDAAYEIIAGKGFTSFGVATAIVRICEAIVRDERAVLPVSSRLTGPPGLPGVCMSMPCIVGAAGIERLLIPAMSEAEAVGLAASAAKLQTAFAELQPDPFAISASQDNAI
ncbi:MAG: lactate dehydrogenase [Novosphingobium sp.]|nr:lactate dehydrogenase [Novosphingobium sp.]